MAKTETPGLDGGDMGGYLNATWLSTSWRVYGEYVDLQDDFNPEVGFLPRAGIRTTKLHLERNPRPDRWGIRVLSPMVNWTYTTDQTGRRVAQRWHYMLGTRFDNGAYLNIWYNDHFDRVDREIEIRPMMNLALSYDHRIVDGREAVSFLVRVKECVESPERILLDI